MAKKLKFSLLSPLSELDVRLKIPKDYHLAFHCLFNEIKVMDSVVCYGFGNPADWRRDVAFWKRAGVTHITCNNTYQRRGHERIEGTTLSDHITGIERFIEAVKDDL